MIWACSGDDGAPGPQGPQGPAGPAGPPGPSGGSGAVPIASAERVNIEVTSVAIPAGGGNPVVQFSLKNDLNQGLEGLVPGNIRFVLSQLSPAAPGSGASSEWQAYTTQDSNGVPNAQADYERGDDGDLVDNGDGTYQYTYLNALTDYPAPPAYDENKSHRIGLEYRGQAPNENNGLYDFVPSAGGPMDGMFTRDIVDNDTCNACHDRLEFHGGARTDVGYCVTCHNPYSTDEDSGFSVDMKYLIHNIHAGRDGFFIVGYRGSIHDYTDVVFPQDLRNCQTCHQESDENTPEASNWRTVANRASCGTCHYDDGDANSGNDFAIEDGVHPGGFNFADDTQCFDCHGPDSTVTNPDGDLVNTESIHSLPLQEISQQFEFVIVATANMAVGQTPTVDLSVVDPTNGNAPYDLLNDPEFTTCDGTSRLAVGIAWNTDDYTNTGSGSNPAQPISMDPLTCFGNPGAQDLGGGVYRVTSGTAIPATASGTAAVTIDGHPAADADGDGTFEARVPVTNVVSYVSLTGGDADERRAVVDIARCDDCHKQLSLHGNNRTDNPEVCVTCHNPNATDARQRGVPGTDCNDLLGPDDVSVDMKYMIHALHASGATGVPYEVCGFRNSDHVYDFVYPGHLNNCEGCHIKDEDTFYPVAAGTTLGTTIDVGADPADPSDDVVISPNTAVCSTCHVSDLAAQHMMQNGGDFAAGKAADSSLISSGVETCDLCHGPGRTSDVKEKHGVADFQFNTPQP
jgi:OmcA/MtrC family decaheme c-type cytochrome